ncbi:g11875 [Coccomyxa elongata]
MSREGEQFLQPCKALICPGNCSTVTRATGEFLRRCGWLASKAAPSQHGREIAIVDSADSSKDIDQLSSASWLWAAASSAQFCRLWKTWILQTIASFQSGTSTLAERTLKLCNTVPGIWTFATWLSYLSQTNVAALQTAVITFLPRLGTATQTV